MPWYLYLAFKQLFPSKKGPSFFAWVSTLGVTLGVMVLVIVQSVMNGFDEEISKKIIATSGHVRIVSKDIITNTPQLVPKLLSMPEVAAASAYAEGVVMLQYQDKPVFPFIWGLDLNSEAQVVPIEQYMISGSLEELDDESIFVSDQLAQRLGLELGSVVEVFSPLMLEYLNKDDVLLPHDLVVAGIFATGWSQVDDNTLIVSLRLLQELYGLGEGVHGIAIRLKGNDLLPEFMQRLASLSELLPEQVPLSWLDSHHDLLFVLKLEKTMMFFIILFIILVASFSIASSLLTAVIRKRREIGLWGALGGRPWQAAVLFCSQGLLIGIAGSVLGILSAVLALNFRNEIVDGFATLTHSKQALVQFYQFAHLPAVTSREDLQLIVAFTVIISMLAGLIPAWQAAKLKPAQAMRD